MLSTYKQINQDLITDGFTPNDLSQISERYWSGEFDGQIGLEPTQRMGITIPVRQ